MLNEPLPSLIAEEPYVESQCSESGTTSDMASELREEVLAHLRALGMLRPSIVGSRATKERIREMHLVHRAETSAREAALFEKHGERLLSHFAEGCEVVPEGIRPEVIPVLANSEEARLFRIATLLWSVPVSKGYGRRLRFIVRDRQNGKLIGLFGLTSPVFNLSVRDDWIGWTLADRESGLVNVMDAFVVGSVPPYNRLLGGKLTASLIGSREVSEHFEQTYAGREGLISGEVQYPRLVLVTTSSALGRSSMYNRLRLPGVIDFKRLGETKGYGHFQVPDATFAKMREYLRELEHPYATGCKYGDGPNWRMRVIRQSLKEMGLDENLLQHGVQREVYAAPLAVKWREYLSGKQSRVHVHRPAASTIGRACLRRWVVSRAGRVPDYAQWTREQTRALILDSLAMSTE